MVRVVLLFVITAGVVIFAFQNPAPIALVVLGLKTPPLPLSIWVLVALSAGALTSLVLNGFSSISKNFAVRRSSQRPPDSAAKSPKSPWSGMGMKSGEAQSTRTARAQNTAGFRATRSDNPRNAEDWDDNRGEDWDDWGEPARSDRSPTSPSAPTREANDNDWAKWDDNQPSVRDTRRSPQPDPSRRIDLGSYPSARTTAADDRYRSSSQEVPRKTGEVYDAEYRVLIPPYNPVPDPPAPNPTPSSADDDEDWGLDDDLEDKTDRSR